MNISILNKQFRSKYAIDMRQKMSSIFLQPATVYIQYAQNIMTHRPIHQHMNMHNPLHTHTKHMPQNHHISTSNFHLKSQMAMLTYQCTIRCKNVIKSQDYMVETQVISILNFQRQKMDFFQGSCRSTIIVVVIAVSHVISVCRERLIIIKRCTQCSDILILFMLRRKISFF